MRRTEKKQISLSGKNVAVLGFGISNRPLVRFLLDKGCNITVRDAKPASDLGEEYTEFSEKGVSFILGKKYLDNITEDIIFRSPGIRPDAGSIPDAVSRGAILTSEMEYFLEETPAYVIAVTGSDGKTTSTTLTYKLLEEEYKNSERHVYIGGNIGKPLLPECASMTDKDFAVVELSSFQLQSLSSPINRAAITNITPNHLNWHTDMEEYTEAKKRVYGSEETEQLAVNANDERTCSAGMSFQGRTVFFSYNKIPDECLPKNDSLSLTVHGEWITAIENGKNTKILKLSDIILPGKHNVENYMTAIANTWNLVSKDTIKKVAATFGGVEHRLEFVRKAGGVKYYNSSIDSSPTRTAAALSALPEKPVVICGGYDKNIPFEPLAEALAKHARAVVLVGDTKWKILAAIEACEDFDRNEIQVIVKRDFNKAIQIARKLADGSGSVLLSPACASFDMFKNFEERGRAFKEFVNQLPN